MRTRDGFFFSGDRWGSNPRQPEPQSGALPAELRPPFFEGAKKTGFQDGSNNKLHYRFQ